MKDSKINWFHILAVSPFLYYYSTRPDIIRYLAIGMAGYHGYRVWQKNSM